MDTSISGQPAVSRGGLHGGLHDADGGVGVYDTRQDQLRQHHQDGSDADAWAWSLLRCCWTLLPLHVLQDKMAGIFRVEIQLQ